MSNRDVLLSSFESGNFFETVYSYISAEFNTKEQTLVSDLTILHNESLINLVDTFRSVKDNLSESHKFFRLRQVFEKTLPNLNASVTSVMHCVLELEKDTEHVFPTGTLFECFIEFCLKESTRPAEALKEIEKAPGMFSDMLTVTLIAGSRIDAPFYLKETIRLCNDPNVDIKKRAYLALGSIKIPEGAAAISGVLDVLEKSVLIEVDDQALSVIIKSAFLLLQRYKSEELRITPVIISAIGKGGENTLHSASEIFGIHMDKISIMLRDALLMHLLQVNPVNKGTLNNIDYGIYYLLKNGDPEVGVQFLEKLLLLHQDDLSIDDFKCTVIEIRENHVLISKLLTRWYLRGDKVLHECLLEIISAHRDDNLTIEIDASELSANDLGQIMFIARKVVGYLFYTKPVCAASIIVSLLRLSTDDNLSENLGSLLLNPLLLNFTGSVRDYVHKQSELESGKVKVTLNNVSNEIEKYLDELKSIDELPALNPSESQRDAYHRHLSEIMATEWEEAFKKSTLLNLFPKRVLLYGRKSINYVEHVDGQSHRMETPLHRCGTNIEVPRMQLLDPVGIDFILRIFRNERMNAA